MLTTAYEKLDGNYGRWSVVREIDEATLNRAREIFDSYKSRGVIVNNSFDDPAWTLFDQAKNVSLTLFPFDIHKTTIGWIGCDYSCFMDCVKAYITFCLGEIGLSTLREMSKCMVSLADKTSVEAAASREYIGHIVSLLQIIPGGCGERDAVIETLEERAEHKSCFRKGKQRRLADFNAYLKFNEALSDYWSMADKRQKLFYFPLFFWWNLTSILPLRPTEFLLTPRDCLQKTADGKDILTIRRTKLKGSSGKIAYRVADDYERRQYVIPGKLADELRFYIRSTVKMKPTTIDTLFLHKPHFIYMGFKQYASSKYYSYACLKTCLRYFYDEVIRSSIARVHLGDTRHIAMASLIISGGSPVICKELAGHADIDISSHYYSNISTLVECVTLERYRKSKGSDTDMSGVSKYPIALPEIRSRVQGGWCATPEVAAGDISECLKVSGAQGYIGDCSHCGHYFPDEPGIRLKFLNEAAGKEKVDADSEYLIRMIELVRKGLGHEEDIGSALLRLQRSSDHYSKCLWEKYARMDGV